MTVSARVVVLAPHLDDAVLSCWSILVDDADVTVVTVFAGFPPADAEAARWDVITGAHDPRRRIEERRAEDCEALALAGRSPVHLGFLEAQYRPQDPTIDELVAAIAEHVPDDAVVFAPAAIKSHADHVLVRRAALALPAARDVGLYAELPYATRFGWPTWVTGTESISNVDVDAYWRLYLDGNRRPVIRCLTEQQQAAKLDALRAYRSQFAALDGGPQRRVSHPELIAYEAFWEAPGAGE